MVRKTQRSIAWNSVPFEEYRQLVRKSLTNLESVTATFGYRWNFSGFLRQINAFFTFICYDIDMEENNKKEPLADRLGEKLLGGLLSMGMGGIWLITIIFVALIIAVGFFLTYGLSSVQRFYALMIVIDVVIGLCLIFAIRGILRKNAILTVVLAAIAAFFIFRLSLYVRDIPYLNDPCTRRLTGITVDMEVDYDPDLHMNHHNYIVKGYDENGDLKKQQIDVTEYDSAMGASTAVISYLPHTNKVVQIDFYS